MTAPYDYEARGRAIKAAKLARLLALAVADTAALEGGPTEAEALGALRDAPDHVRASVADTAGTREPSALTWAMACDLAADALGIPNPEIH